MSTCTNYLKVEGTFSSILDFESRFKTNFTEEIIISTILAPYEYSRLDEETVNPIIRYTMDKYVESTGNTADYISHTIIECDEEEYDPGTVMIDMKVLSHLTEYTFNSFIRKPSTILNNPRKWMEYNWSSLSDCVITSLTNPVLYINADIEEEVTTGYTFVTECDYPRNVITAMAEEFPDLTFTLYYGNYQSGFAGIYGRKNEEYTEDEYYESIRDIRIIYNDYLTKNHYPDKCSKCKCPISSDDYDCPYCSEPNEHYEELPF